MTTNDVFLCTTMLNGLVQEDKDGMVGGILILHILDEETWKQK
jgi:hypothetical protein